VFDRHGYVAYDPQLERVYQPARDRLEAEQVHRDVQARVFESLERSGDEASWWRRLLARR